MYCLLRRAYARPGMHTFNYKFHQKSVKPTISQSSLTTNPEGHTKKVLKLKASADQVTEILCHKGLG